MLSNLRSATGEYLSSLNQLLLEIDAEKCDHIAEVLYQACVDGRSIYVCGNGGSASTASHMACDISKNVSAPGIQRPKVVSLADNLAHFSAIANDLDYSMVFVEQLKNLMRHGDILIAISASGNSPNVVKAAKYARELDCDVITLTGFTGGELRGLSTAAFHVDCTEYGPVEDLHLVFNHIMVVVLREMLSKDQAD